MPEFMYLYYRLSFSIITMTYPPTGEGVPQAPLLPPQSSKTNYFIVMIPKYFHITLILLHRLSETKVILNNFLVVYLPLYFDVIVP